MYDLWERYLKTLQTTYFISHILMIFIASFVLVAQGVGGAASVLMLLVIGLSVLVVVMGVCLCRVRYKQIDRQKFSEVRLTQLT